MGCHMVRGCGYAPHGGPRLSSGSDFWIQRIGVRWYCFEQLVGELLRLSCQLFCVSGPWLRTRLVGTRPKTCCSARGRLGAGQP